MSVSYAQKTSAFYGYIRGRPNDSANSIIKHFKGTPYKVRRTDALDLIKQLKNANEYRLKMNESKAPKETKKRANKAIYQRAKMTSKKYTEKHPVKKGKKIRSVSEVDEATFGSGERPDDFADRY